MSSTSSPEPADRRWSVKDLRDWIDILFKIVLASAGIIVGYYFSVQKQQNDDIKLVVDMVTDPSDHKRVMGGSIAKSYYQQNRIPADVYVTIFAYANSVKAGSELQAVVNTGIEAAVRANPTLQQAVTKASAELPVRIFMHIRQESDRERAQQIATKLGTTQLASGQSLIFPGIEWIAGEQSGSVLRCFKPSECQQLGPALIDLFKRSDVSLKLQDLSATYGTSTTIRPNQFEIWFAKDLR